MAVGRRLAGDARTWCDLSRSRFLKERKVRACVSLSQLLAWAPPVNQDTYLPQTGACRSHLTLLALHAVQVRRCWLTKATKGGFCS